MAGDGWLESGTRIPFVGIIAIVVIVAVVALFVKVSFAPLFPASDVTVEDGNALTGMVTGSESFYGIREIDLQRKELLRGTLTTPQESLIFTLDVPQKLLTIQHERNVEEIELHSLDERLTAAFEYYGQQAVVDIDPAKRELVFHLPQRNAQPITIMLSDTILYRGEFLFRSETHKLEFWPASTQATIKASRSARVQLEPKDNLYTGVWTDGKTNRPMTVDVQERVARIENIY
jgi:hypothetical protein